MTKQTNSFNARTQLDDMTIYSLSALEKAGLGKVGQLPFSIKVLLEALLRTEDGFEVTADDVRRLAAWDPKSGQPAELPFKPARVILQDFTGVPSVVDLAAMRSAMHRLGGDPAKINPLVPVDLVIDHSVQVDHFGSDQALTLNMDIEFYRNRERYEFLAWGRNAFDNFRVVPPATGIVHQVNLEYLANVVQFRDGVAFPDSLVGTDSHTTMINGIGVLGWGVGGIEAEAVMLGQPIYMLTPEVIGFKLYGKLSEGVTATDLTLTVVQMLRQKGVVGKFVEFYGSGLSNITLPDRATMANMAPEYGATMGFFPVDDEALDYMRRTGRPADLVARVEAYTKAQGLFRTDDTPDPVFTDTLELDLGTVETSLAGPKRPQDRIALGEMKSAFAGALTTPAGPQGFGLSEDALDNTGTVADESAAELKHGAVVIAAITSCTNTSNPSVMLAAGLLAKKAVEAGLAVKPYVKTSLAPGSRVVTAYYRQAGLQKYLDELGFNTVGYGCTTCIGNSGPLPEAVEAAVDEGQLVVASVLSGNRNFEGRVHSKVKASYLASPPLVVAYALAGTVDIDLSSEPLGTGKDGQPVYLRDVWPSQQEIYDTIAQAVNAEQFTSRYSNVFDGNPTWNEIAAGGDGSIYNWSDDSTYIQEPPFFTDLTLDVGEITPIVGARVLVLAGDSITTDHISPAGQIAKASPAGKYLLERDVAPQYFNSYGSRRGNDRVMTRGTFANVRLKNKMAPGTEGGFTTDLSNGEVTSIYDASLRYKGSGTPLVVLAGKDYGMGSSRDWAAKGTLLLGVKAVIAASFERIHRSNLVGMGVLPLEFTGGQTWQSLGLTGKETFDIQVPTDLQPKQTVKVTASRDDGSALEFETVCRIDTPVEIDYYRNGGILHTVLRRLAAE